MQVFIERAALAGLCGFIVTWECSSMFDARMRFGIDVTESFGHGPLRVNTTAIGRHSIFTPTPPPRLTYSRKNATEELSTKQLIKTQASVYNSIQVRKQQSYPRSCIALFL